MKKYITLLVFCMLLVGCSNDSDTLLNEGENNGKSTNIVFGKKIGEKEIQADNVFQLGETTHFLISSKNNFNISKVTIVLKKMVDGKWKKLTEAELEINPESKQFLNGLPGSLYQTAGPGAYKLEVINNGELLVEGDYVVEAKK